MSAAKIAVIAVHGVADQKPGATARDLVDLLVATAPSGCCYQAIGSESITLQVEPLQAASQVGPRSDATPHGEDRPVVKAILQSLRSDFQRRNWRASQDATTAWHAFRAPMVDDDGDRGIEATAYLLDKHIGNGASRECFETTRIGLQRTDAAGSRADIDLYEMYWADLSRLAGALPRIVTELFTMIFRLSRLGRDTVDEARAAMQRAPGADKRSSWFAWSWIIANALQIGLDWIFVNGLALLFLQLALIGLLLMGLGVLGAIDPLVLHNLHPLAAAAVAIAGLLLFAYRYRERPPWPLIAPLALIAFGSSMLFIFKPWQPWLTMLLLIGLVTLVSETGLRIADDRFPLVRSIGRVMWTTLALLVLASAWLQLAPAGVPPTVDLGVWIRGSVFGSEVALQAIKLLWISFGVLLLPWLIAGLVAARERGYESNISIATGRLGLGMSVGAFLVVTMTIWALLSGVFGAAVRGVDYAPCVFRIEAEPPPEGLLTKLMDKPVVPVVVDRAAPLIDPTTACLWTVANVRADRANERIAIDASQFLHQRYVGTTGAFALVAIVLLVLVIFLLTMFLPSVLAEMKLLVERMRNAFSHAVQPPTPTAQQQQDDVVEAEIDETRARRLGRWLTIGYRSIDGVTGLVFAVAVFLALAVALAFMNVAPFVGLAEPVQQLSQGLLQPMVIGAAGITASLVLFGGLLSRYLPGLRGPLDIALDVDNHFREFPRDRIPRARIFSRYAVLLRHVQSRGYDRIVIVAHSQGSVISCELLRFLASDGQHAPQPGAKPRIGGRALAPIRLMTLGCPLRQLYAARFPTLYRWVIERHGAVSGPRAVDIGVERWINAFCSGDYVGRWLWSSHPPDDGDVVGHPMVDSADRAFGRSDAYAGFHPMPPTTLKLGCTREVEICLGLGAHTHYFEQDQTIVAYLIDHLITADCAAEPAADQQPARDST